MANRGVLLVNLGSPDSTSVPDVRKYLKEFLLDERVIDAPAPIRNALVRGVILPTRPRKSAEAYQRVWTGQGSPLIVISQKQRDEIARERDFPVALAMRYGNPSIPSAVRQLAEAGVDELLLAPLYPHYAMSSYETVVVRVMEEVGENLPDANVTLLQPFYQDADYIDALVESAQPCLADGFDHLLFSFHGIPERHLRKTDPSHAHCLARADCCESAHPAHATCYRRQCFATVKAFVQRAGVPEEKHSVSFQSRLGRDPWLKPYTDFVLEELPKQGKKKLLVICPAFITDCLETLEEISMEGKEDFLNAGGESFFQIPCLNDHPAFFRFINGRIDRWVEHGESGLRTGH